MNKVIAYSDGGMYKILIKDVTIRKNTIASFICTRKQNALKVYRQKPVKNASISTKLVCICVFLKHLF